MVKLNLRKLAHLAKLSDDLIGELIWREISTGQVNFRLGWGFVRIVDAGEPFDFPCPGFLVQALRVALLAHRQWCIHKHLDEVTGRPTRFNNTPHGITIGLIGTDESSQYQHAGLAEKIGHGTNTADVFGSVLRSKAEPKPLSELRQ